MIFLGIILVAKERGHLTVDIVVSALPAKVQMYLLFFADILVLVALSFITYGAYQLMLLTYTQKCQQLKFHLRFYILQQLFHLSPISLLYSQIYGNIFG